MVRSAEFLQHFEVFFIRFRREAPKTPSSRAFLEKSVAKRPILPILSYKKITSISFSPENFFYIQQNL